MAKDKKKAKGEKGAKAPKAERNGGGLKLPKALKNFGSLDQVVSSPLAREILADMLIAAAGAAAAALVKNRPSASQVADAGVTVVDAGAKAARETKDFAQTAAGAVAEVVVDAARQFLPTALSGETVKDAPRTGEGHAGEIAEAAYDEGGRKKKSRDKPQPSEH